MPRFSSFCIEPQDLFQEKQDTKDPRVWDMFKILFYKIARSLSIGENGQKMVYKMFISNINNLGLILGRSKIVQTMFNHCKHVLLESSMGDYLVFGFHRRFSFVIKTDVKIENVTTC